MRLIPQISASLPRETDEVEIRPFARVGDRLNACVYVHTSNVQCRVPWAIEAVVTVPGAINVVGKEKPSPSNPINPTTRLEPVDHQTKTTSPGNEMNITTHDRSLLYLYLPFSQQFSAMNQIMATELEAQLAAEVVIVRTRK